MEYLWNKMMGYEERRATKKSIRQLPSNFEYVYKPFICSSLSTTFSPKARCSSTSA